MFIDPTRLSALLKGCLAVYLAVSLVSVWSSWLEIDLLTRAQLGGEVTEEDAELSDNRRAAAGGLAIVIAIVTGVVFLRWTYVASRNAYSFDASGMRFTPGWAVGWYFIPLLTLWKPYQALVEVFRVSHPGFGSNWRLAPRPRILPIWWTLWIAATFLGQAVVRLAFRADTIDEILLGSRLTFAAELLDVPLCLAAIQVVSTLQKWQSDKRSLPG